MSSEQLMTFAQSGIIILSRDYLDIIDEHPVDHILTSQVIDGSERAPTNKKRVAGFNRGTISMSEDFNDPLPDEFWLGRG
jgi:hypothetical protein